jgi:putative tricarboxylic transport membrane protein
MSDSMMGKKTEIKKEHDMGGIFCATVFIVLGSVCLYETTQMTDPDSYVFPRMVIAGLIGLSLVLIVDSLLKPRACASEYKKDAVHPSTLRRVLLVIAMMGAPLLMPWIGFLLTGMLVVISSMLLAQYDPWTKRKLFIYTFVSMVIVFGFYIVFSQLLQVPLPEGEWFQFL